VLGTKKRSSEFLRDEREMNGEIRGFVVEIFVKITLNFGLILKRVIRIFKR